MSFYSIVDTAVDCLRPLVKKLAIRENFDFERTVHLIEIPELDFLNLDNWSIILMREKLPNSQPCGRLVTRYRKEQDLFQYIIYLDETLFNNTEPSRMKRKIVFIHEFTHFAARIYAFSTNKEKYVNSLEQRLDTTIDEIFNPDVSTLYHLLKDKESRAVDPYNTFKHSQHAHFYLGQEKIDLSYTDLYLNLLFSKGAFEEFFDMDNQKKFYQLWKNNKRTEAIDLYFNLTKEAAKVKWVPEQFAVDQTDSWLIDYIKKPLI